MDKFKTTIYGYDKGEVNAYLDEIINLGATKIRIRSLLAAIEERNNH